MLEINAIPNADYILKISYIGYDEVSKQITIDKDVRNQCHSKC
jgi:hypothetical protein